jgi:cytochrome c oxidase assembly protein subunit 15
MTVSRPSERAVRRLATASLVSQIGIVLTGGAVRLTASGLGCPTFPRCTEDSFVTTAESGVHGAIEFGNRLLTFVLAAIAIATLVAVLRSRPRRRDLVVPAVVLFLGIPAQALIGGITVLTQLNPWVVMLHFMASAVLIGVATVLARRSREPYVASARNVPVGSVWLRRLAGLVLLLGYVTVYLGTVVTGSGPHAGDPDSPRTGLDVESVSQLHADAVFLFLGLTIGIYLAAKALGSPGRVVVAAGRVLLVSVAQGVLGFVQYALAVPAPLVALHMLGASLLVAACADLFLSTAERRPADAADTAGSAQDSRIPASSATLLASSGSNAPPTTTSEKPSGV